MAFSFGTPAPAASGSTSLFGTPASKAPFSFGTPAPSTSASTSSLFGTPQTQPQAQTQPAQPSTGLFGAKPASGGLFGAAPSTGLFGSTAAPSQGLFGQSTAAPPATGLFGQSSSAPGLFGGLQSSTQQPQQQAQPQQAQPTLSKNTKFEELAENEKKLVQEMETFIASQKGIEEELRSKDLGATIRKCGSDVHGVSIDLTNLLAVLDQSRRSAEDVRRRFELDLDDICRSVKIVDHFKGTASATLVNQATHGVVDSSFPFKFFKRKIEDMAERLRLYTITIEELKGQIHRQDADQIKAILPTLKAQHTLALTLAGKVASIHDDLDEMRSVYTLLWRDKTGNKGTLRDPFIDAGIPANRDQLSSLSIGVS